MRWFLKFILFILIGTCHQNSIAQVKKNTSKTYKAVKIKYKKLTDTLFRKGDIIRAPEIYFNLSSCAVLPEHKDSVKLISDFLLRHPSFKIEIGAHTDSRGSAPFNLKLTQCRANSVKDVMLHEFSSPSDRVIAKGYGEEQLLISEPVISKTKDAGHKEQLYHKNRRIEIKILDIQ
jgi:outer membrane protein OmpA-like peptidoglycan-associated protein